jgi:uncharacterized protein
MVLFGSYAYGTPNADSDVDILVVSDKRGSRYAQTVSICQAVMAPFPLDLIVRSQAEMGGEVRGGECFMEEIARQGLVLYDADNRAMGEKGRRRLRHRFAAAPVAQAVTI